MAVLEPFFSGRPPDEMEMLAARYNLEQEDGDIVHRRAYVSVLKSSKRQVSRERHYR
jgi:hypothetical protein